MLDGDIVAMIALEPVGSLIYKGTAEGTFDSNGHTHQYGLHVDANQPLALRVSSVVESTLTLTHSVAGSITLPADLDPGAGQLYQPLKFTASGQPVAGIVTITIEGEGAGYYSIEAALNAQFDQEGWVTAQALDAGTIAAGNITRGAVIGSLERPVMPITQEAVDGNNDLGGSWTPADTSNKWWIGDNGAGVRGSITSKSSSADYWWFRVHAGDIFTIHAVGRDGDRECTLSKTIVTTWDANNEEVTGQPVAGAPSDSIIRDASLPRGGICVVMVSTDAGNRGTYKLKVDLQTPTDPRPNSMDVYTFSAAAGQYISFAAATGRDTVSQPRVQLALSGPGINEPIPSQSNGTLDGLIEYKSATGGTYTITVTPGAGLMTASTSYNLVAVSNGTVDNGKNGDFASAQEIKGLSGVLGDLQTSASTFVSAGSGGLSRAMGLTFGPENRLFVSSWNSDEVMRYQGPGPNEGAPAGISRKSSSAVFVKAGLGGLDAPEWLRFDRDGNLYVVSSAKNQVLRYNGTTGASMGVFVTTSTNGLYHPTGLVFGPDRNLYVGGSSADGRGIVHCYSGANGSFIRALDYNHTGGLTNPQGLALGPDYNKDGIRDLYVSSSGTDEVLRYDNATNKFVTFVYAGSGGLDEPTGLAFGLDGNLYVSSRITNEVLRYNGAPTSANGPTSFIDAYVTAGAGGLARPGDLAWGPDGNLYVAGQDQSIVYQVSAGEDYYKVTLSGGCTYAFETSTPESARGQLDPHIGLYKDPPSQDPSSQVAWGIDSGDGRNEVMSYEVPSGAGGEYYIKVAGGQKSVSGDYVLNPIVEVSRTSSQPTAVSQPTDYAALAAAAVYGNGVSRCGAADRIFSDFGRTARKNRCDGLAVDLVDIDYLFSK